MSVPIKTNKITYSIEKESLFSKYDVFRICTTDKYFNRGAYIIDAPLLNNGVCSVLFQSGREFFVLMRKNQNNLSNLKATIVDAEGFEYITISQMQSNEVNDVVILQLLLNSLGSYNSSFLSFNNLTGHLYCFHPNWLVRSRKNENNAILKVPCLELKLSSDFHLKMEVHTFTSELLRNNIEFKKKRFEEYPKYVFSAHNTLRRRLESDTEKSFIMRQTRNAKTEIPFLDIQNIERFNQSKMGILTLIINTFNENFASIANINFGDVSQYESLDYTRTVANENKNTISNLLTDMSIKIVDCIDDEYSKIFCDEIMQLLLDKYDIKAKCGKRIDKECLNIRVIHNAAYYTNCEDEYRIFDDIAVQHITFEDFCECSEFAISTVIHELLIKNDLKNKHISLFDWQSLKFDETIDFGIEYSTENKTKYYFMSIHPDGNFDISEQTLNLFETNQYNQCVEIFENAKINSEIIHGIIRDKDGNVNIIKDTGWFTIPEIFALKGELSSGNTKLRGKEKREELLSSCLDIKMFEANDMQYYFVGTIGNGMRWLINRAANIRRIEPFEDSDLMLKKLLPLMNVTFVRNGQLTITPFPFKYLREYVKNQK